MLTPRLLKQREQVLDLVRRFFKAQGFTEVETPALVASPGMEPHLDPFAVRGSATGLSAWLHTSPEFAMKKLVAAGSGSIFQICKAWRDEPPSEHHLPEFTILEWYRVGADYHAVMNDCENLCAHLATAIHAAAVHAAAVRAAAVRGGARIPWQGNFLDFTPPSERLTVREAFRRYAAIGLRFDEPLDHLRTLAREAGCIDLAPDDNWDDIFFKAFLRHVEPHLGRTRPTILSDYPAHMAALSRISPADPLVCERFELYAGGLELANAFTELTDPIEQRRRFEEDNAKRRALGRPELPIDQDLLAALPHMPPCAGVALGLDRLIMLLTDTPDIRNVLPFPPQT